MSQRHHRRHHGASDTRRRGETVSTSLPEWNNDTKVSGLFDNTSSEPRARRRRPLKTVKTTTSSRTTTNSKKKRVTSNKRTSVPRRTHQPQVRVKHPIVSENQLPESSSFFQPTNDGVSDEKIYWAFHAVDRSGSGSIEPLSAVRAIETLGLVVGESHVVEYTHIVNEGRAGPAASKLEFEDFKTLVRALECVKESTDDSESQIVSVKSHQAEPIDRAKYEIEIVKDEREKPIKKRSYGGGGTTPRVFTSNTTPKSNTPRQSLVSRQSKASVVKSPEARTSTIYQMKKLHPGLQRLTRKKLVSLVTKYVDKISDSILNELLTEVATFYQEQQQIERIPATEMEELNNVMNSLEGILQEEGRVTRKLRVGIDGYATEEKEREPSPVLHSATTAAFLAKQVRPPRVVELPPTVVQRIEGQQKAFARHRRIAESSLLDTGFNQADIVEILEDSIVFDTITSIAEEMESLFDIYAEAIFRTL